MLNSTNKNHVQETTMEQVQVEQTEVFLVLQGLDLLLASRFTLLGGRCVNSGQRCPDIL